MDTVFHSIKPVLQIFADSASNLLKLDVEIIDRKLERIACTGMARSLIGNRLTPEGVLNDTLYRRKEKNTVIERPGTDSRCIHCHRYGQCPWKGAIYSAIWINGNPCGIFGLTASSESQSRHLFENMEQFIAYSNIMSEFLGGYIQAVNMSGHSPDSLFHFNTYLSKEQSLVCDMLSDSGNDISVPQSRKQSDDFLPQIFSQDSDFISLKKLATKISIFPSTVLITGETGTGKELFAKGIHMSSLRKEGPFIPVNCGAVPENLIESELFGHSKGAFTGAYCEKKGKFLMADKGTLFLDEVENMPHSLQQKLLRVLELKEVEILGSGRAVPVDIRIIAATNKPLWPLVKQGSFREDLFHRLNVITLEIPPLRNRGNDVLLLAERFLEEFRESFQHPVRELSPEVQDLFLKYHWPGNVRELKNTIEHGSCMCEEPRLQLKHLPGLIRDWGNSEKQSNSVNEKELLKEMLQKYGLSEQGKIQAAKELGISRSTLYRKIKKYQL